MPAGQFTAGEVMDMAASLLNDTAKSIYTYVAQLPYVKIALEELSLEFQLNNIPITNVTSQIIPVDLGDIQINPPGGSPPNYPGDLTAIEQIWERAQGSNDPWIPLREFDFLPHSLDDVPAPALIYFAWMEEIIKFNPSGCTTPREVKLDFISNVIPDVVDQATVIGIINTKNFLGYRTAALCATFVQQNQERMTACNASAQMAMDQVTGIDTKGRQAISTRRRPFRSSYRQRGIW